MRHEEWRGDVQSEEDADAGPDISGTGDRIVDEGFKKGEDNEDGRLARVEQEGKVDDDLVDGAVWLVELLHDVDVLWRSLGC